ncbi:MAG: hypothetical protein L6R28_24160 [Planctomycetes bacterium]|nr:hypothetical protein [Planctomycetota bacterium]
MDQVIGGWGLTANQTLLGIAALLVAIDFFIATDLPTHVAYVLLSILVALNVDVHPLYRSLAGCGAWFALVVFHYLVWRQVLRRFADRVVTPDRFKDAPQRVVGAVGELKVIEERRMVAIDGDLWPLDPAQAGEAFAAGHAVRVVKVNGGAVQVEAVRTAPESGGRERS